MKNQNEDIMLLGVGDGDTSGGDTSENKNPDNGGTGNNSGGNNSGNGNNSGGNNSGGGPVEPDPNWGIGGLSLDKPETDN